MDKKLVRILVADDEQSIRDMLGMTLKEDGWTVELAENGRVALEKVSKSPFHIILSDIQMPELSGIELLEAVKKKNPNIEVVIMTSNATLETALKALKSGAFDYLHKPFEDLSVVPRKMLQVAERILLRQQNLELLKRLKVASKQLKLLFEATRELNGILSIDDLRSSVMKSVVNLFEDKTVKAVWLKRMENSWNVQAKIPDETAFGSETSFGEIDTLGEKFPDLRKVKVVRLEKEGQIAEAIAFENLSESLSDFFFQEVRTCYEKVSLHQKVLSMANKDGLTGLYNHRYFQDRLRQEISQVKRQEGQLSVVLMDVDHFKKYNDSHGHPAGDELLRQLSNLLKNEAGNRESDIVARYGGEEFVIMLPFTPYDGAMIKAQRICKAVAEYAFPHREAQPLGCVSVSVGVATLPDHASEPTLLLELADQALYAAKHGGRNRVMGYVDIPKKTVTEEKPLKQVSVMDLPPPPALPSPGVDAPKQTPKKTLDSVLKSVEIAQPTPTASSVADLPPVELSSLMSSIESAFAQAEKDLQTSVTDPSAKKESGGG